MPPNLTDCERREIIDEMLERSLNGVLPRGLPSELARRWGCDRATTSALWSSYQARRGAVDAWKSQIKVKSGRKCADRAEVCTKLCSVPVGERQVERHVAACAGVSRYMVRALQKEGTLSRRTSRIKPALTEANKLHRVEFSLSHVDESSMSFEPMLDVIHVDEKWFNADKDKRSYLGFDGEEPPPRFFKSKRFIPKTMFLAAFARPRHDPHRKATWDGKIGIWAFTEEYAAQRTSRNRKKGVVCVRNLPTIDRTVYKRYLLEYLFPAIKKKWPRKDRRRVIWAQQDNAKPHVSQFDPDIVAAGVEGGWNIRLTFQPPNSPDTNVCDLGLFASLQSLQSLQYRKYMRTVEDIVRAVEEAYDEMSIDALDNIFLSFQNCLRCILQYDGSNTYKLPHLGKSTLRKAGMLPMTLSCDSVTYDKALSLLVGAKRSSALLFNTSSS